MGKPRASTIDGYEGRTADHVQVEDRDTFTGLYDHNGVPLHRPQSPIGFDPHRWDKPKRQRNR